MSGVSLAKSPLDILLWTNTANNPPTRTTSLELDIYYQVGGVLKFSLAGVIAEY
jgi:hypothetical protein